MENLRAREIAYQQELTHMLYGRTVRFLERNGIAVLEDRLPADMLGESLGGNIIIETRIEPVIKLATLLHEAAHELLHWNVNGSSIQIDRRTQETQAEAISYGVLYDFGISDLRRSTAYIAQYGSFEVLKRDRDIIRNARDYFVASLSLNSTTNRGRVA